MEKEISEIALKLIRAKQEGAYWDFKRQWADNACDLLHDIICMANNLENRDSYIIIGIDEQKDFDFFDISKDVNRRNTQQVVDMLKDKKFAGGVRPIAIVHQIKVNDDAIIDVVEIKNSRNTPFYLEVSYDKLRANHIYTRKHH